MTEDFDVNESSEEISYAFRFNDSDEVLYLTQAQVNQIPYLCRLVEHKDDFASMQNENGEFVLNDTFEYLSFEPIVNVATSRQLYNFFNDLPEKCNICNTLQLMDFLCIDPFPLPVLRDSCLTLSNPMKANNDEKHMVFRRATLSEARETAAEFVRALANNEYNLNDSDTIEEIFYLVKIIVSQRTVFSPRFRHHTMKVAKHRCFPFFSKTKQRHLPTIETLTKQRANDKLLYSHNSSYIDLDDLGDILIWKGTYVVNEDCRKNLTVASGEKTDSFMSRMAWIMSSRETGNIFFDVEDTRHTEWVYPILFLEKSLWRSTFQVSLRLRSKSAEDVFSSYFNEDQAYLYIAEPSHTLLQNKKANEAYAARAGHFNTLPKRPKVDKFKYPFNQKTARYR